MTDTMEGVTGPSARIDVETLKEDLKRFKERLEGWADSIVIKTETEKSQHVQEMQKMSGTVENLRKEHRALQEEALRIRQRLQHEEEEQHDLERELEDVRSRQAELPGIISQVQEALNAEASSLFRKKAKAESKESVQKDLEKGLGKIIDTYSRELGLTLSPTHCGIEVGFTQIDEEDPDRSFTIYISCRETGEYSVDSKSPCAADLSQLVEDLNATGDFSTFVFKIRKVFVDSCQ